MSITRENTNIHKSNFVAILHTDATSPDGIHRITLVPEIKSTGCINDAMLIRYGIV